MSKIEEELKLLDKNRLGYKMLKDTIFIMFRCNCNAALYKDVFPQVGKKYNKSAESVERDIRYLLKKAGSLLSVKKFIKNVVDKMYS